MVIGEEFLHYVLAVRGEIDGDEARLGTRGLPLNIIKIKKHEQRRTESDQKALKGSVTQ